MGEQNTNFDKAKNKALGVLARRMHTKKELVDKLVRGGFDEDIACEVSLWAEEYGFINDEEYTRMYIGECMNSKKYGVRRIKQALLFKGVDANTIEDVLCETEFDEAESLEPLVQKKLSGNYERKNIDKVVRHFMGKGFSYPDIKRAIEHVKSDIELDGGDEFEL